MKKIILLSLAALCVTAAQAFAYKDNDFQVWNTDTEEFRINKEARLYFEQEFRWGRSATQFFYQHYDIGVLYDLSKHLNIGAGYRQVEERKGRRFKPENAPFICASLFWEFLGCKFEDRHRMEYRHFDYQADSWRYRNKISAKLPWRLTALKFQPYLSDEILIGFAKIDELNQNRFAGGFGMDLAKNIKAELYYMLVSTKSSGRWTNANVLGTKLKVSF